MNREQFEEQFKNRNIKPLDDEDKMTIVLASLARCTWQDKAVVIMEELAELQKEVSKMYRGEGDCYAVLEEMADVIICMDFLKIMNGLSDYDVDKAIAIKLNREKERCDNGER